ncbi:hypothetical protein ACIP2X_17740 [Streptomyces sp. NPDC089424]|uniref:hypothetical protein n=1 Tax=Streptomyces sp. NPDC089424 TaxID=3365917 RepID=UPI0037FE2199
MSGRADSETPPEAAQGPVEPVQDAEGPEDAEDAQDPEDAEDDGSTDDGEDDGQDDAEDDGDPLEEARRARWTAAGTGGLLAAVGTAASVLRAAGTAPALVPAAYALGAAVCAGAAVLGSRGRTRRALWLLVGGVTVMALGDQFD